MPTYLITACGFLALILFLHKRDKKSSTSAIALKTITSVLFIVCAVTSFMSNLVATQNMDLHHILPMGLLVIGLVFGMVGDIFLDFKIYFKTLNMRFLCLDHDYDLLMITGMSAFGIGHIFYLVASLLQNQEYLAYFFISLIAGAFAIAFVMIFSIKVMKMNFRKFLIPCTLYGFLLSSFVIFSIIRFCNANTISNLLLMIGSILFIVSDLILSITYFSKEEDYDKEGAKNPESRFMIVINHTTYYIAQYLIAIAILFI